jgi:predicted signal transduction protein with EAL and GGDEF domain
MQIPSDVQGYLGAKLWLAVFVGIPLAFALVIGLGLIAWWNQNHEDKPEKALTSLNLNEDHFNEEDDE